MRGGDSCNVKGKSQPCKHFTAGAVLHLLACGGVCYIDRGCSHPPGRRDKRSLSTYIFAAVRTGHDDAFALVLPEARAVTIDVFLARFAATLPAGAHAVLMLHQAGWHGQAASQVTDNVTLLPLPPYSRELNPVERVWLYLRERFLSFRLYPDEGAIVGALCTTWNALPDEVGRLTTLTSYPGIIHAIDQVSK